MDAVHALADPSTGSAAGVMPDAPVEPLAGQTHEGMTTAPALFAEAVTRFLAPLDSPVGSQG